MNLCSIPNYHPVTLAYARIARDTRYSGYTRRRKYRLLGISSIFRTDTDRQGPMCIINVSHTTLALAKHRKFWEPVKLKTRYFCNSPPSLKFLKISARIIGRKGKDLFVHPRREGIWWKLCTFLYTKPQYLLNPNFWGNPRNIKQPKTYRGLRPSPIFSKLIKDAMLAGRDNHHR